MLRKSWYFALLVPSFIPATAMADETAELQRRVEAALPPYAGACVLAIDGGQVVFEHATGLADVENKAACTPETNFRIASVSKQFTAAAVMLLIERRQLSLDDRLPKFFPDFPEYGRDITVKHLLTHTSALPDYEDLVPHGTTLQLDDTDVLRLLMDVKPANVFPGRRFQYSNSGYVLLGLIVELVSKKPFHEFMAAEIFKPLGMENTVLFQRGLNAVPRRAFGHSWRNEQWVRDDQSVTSATRGDGAIYTSLRDYRKWLTALDERKLLQPESYELLFTPHVITNRGTADRPVHYGFGWFLDEYRGQPRIYHNGETRGFRLTVQRFPKRRAAVFVQINSEMTRPPNWMTHVGERLADLLIFSRDK